MLRLADEELRRALARELHDRVAQTLTTILVELENFKADQVGRQGVLDHVDAMQGSMREVLISLRELLIDLRGDSFSAGDKFADAVHVLLTDFQRRTGIEARLAVQSGWPAQIKPAAALNLHRITEEAVVNARRHSGATTVQVTLRPLSEKTFALSITDDGRGFEPDLVPPGMGTVGMRERALLIGARLRIESRLGIGTTIHVIIPRSSLA